MTPAISTLTLALLDGPFETPLWSSFLEGLRLAVGADYATLVCQAPSGNLNDALYLLAGNATAEDAIASFQRFGYPDNPIRRNLAEDSRLYTLAEIRDREFDLNPAFFAELTETIGASPVFFRTIWFAAATTSGRKRRIQARFMGALG